MLYMVFRWIHIFVCKSILDKLTCFHLHEFLGNHIAIIRILMYPILKQRTFYLFSYRCLNHAHSVLSHLFNKLKNVDFPCFSSLFQQGVQTYECSCSSDTSAKKRKENLLYAYVNKFSFKLRSFLFLLIYTCTPTVFFFLILFITIILSKIFFRLSVFLSGPTPASKILRKSIQFYQYIFQLCLVFNTVFFGIIVECLQHVNYILILYMI